MVVLGVIIASLFSVVVLPAAPAQADDCFICYDVTPGSNGSGGTIPDLPGTPPGGGTDGGGDDDDGGGGGDGGTITGDFADSGQGFFPSAPPSQIGGRGGAFTDYSHIYKYDNKCGGNYSWSAGGKSYSAPYIGWRWSIVGDFVPVHIMPGDNQPGEAGQFAYLKHVKAGGYECIPPPKYLDTQVKCSIRAQASSVGPMRNPAEESGTVAFPNQQSAFAKGGKKDVSLCNRSYVYKFGTMPTKFGQYELTGRAYASYCTYRLFFTADARTGKVPAAVILGCGPQFQDGIDTAQLEIFCNTPYYHVGVFHDDHTFTPEDCENQSWNCGTQINQQPSFAGTESDNDPFSVLDDGKLRRAAWSTVRPEGGVRRITGKQTYLRYMGGSPFRTGSSVNGADQPFEVEPGLNQWTSGWPVQSGNNTKTAYDMRWLAAGVEGDPFTVRPDWKFDAQFSTYVPTIKWDLLNNDLSVTLQQAWLDSTGTCTGQPLPVDVKRARSSSQ